MPRLTPRLAIPQGEHFDLLKSRIPGWYSGAIVQRQQELSDHELELPGWYAKASPDLRDSLKDSHAQYRERLNQVDNRLGNIQDIRAFAEPLLEQAILAEFKQVVNVNEVYFVRKYGRKTRDDFFSALVLDSEGGHFDRYEYRGMSLLEAALANFEADEERKPACEDCNLMTTVRPFYGGDVRPTIDAVRAGALPIAPEAFARLCRKLDLGRQYQAHINAVVRPDGSKAYDHSLSEHHRQGLALSNHIARAKADISPAVYQMLQQVIGGASSITLDGQAVTFKSLKIFDIELVGPVLIGPDLERSRRVVPVVAYLPGDPEQPLKAYASSVDFMAELRRRLHNSAYRRFFSRFVPLRQQGVFFRRFKQLYQPSPTVDDQADYPLKSSLRNLPMDTAPIPGDLWDALRLRQIEKIQADARAVAVPTGDEDQKARLARLDSYLDAVVDVFNLAAFVVPGLGPLMLTVGAVQMFNEAFEGIEAFERGETREMWAHFSSVALNTAFVATGAAVLPHIQWSGTVDRLEPVQLTNGEARLWRPDLSVYQSELAPPAAANPDAQGLYRVGDQQILPLGEQHFEVQQDPQTLRYRIRHPSRPDAYQPELTDNGNGAWHHELEQPRTWEGSTLMRRLGHGVKDFSDAELEQIRLASATPQDVLRRLHVEGEPVPALLADTLGRFDLCRQIDTFIGQLQSEAPPGHDLAEPMLHLLTQYGPWPRGLKLKIVDGTGRTRWEYVRPSESETPVREASLTEAKVRTPALLKNLIEAVDAVGVDLLATASPPIAKTNMDARVRHLRQTLAEAAVSEKVQLLNDYYALGETRDDPHVALIKSRFPSVPATAIEQIITLAGPEELQQMDAWDFAEASQTKPIPLRIAEELRHFQRAVRLNRAYEGLYQDALVTADTPRLVLATLETLPGWSDTLRIELREANVSGTLIDSIGPHNAAQTKIVVRDDDRYQAFDDNGNELSHWGSVFDALQHALPDAERRAMARPSIHHGDLLKKAIGASPVGRDTLASCLKMPALKPTFKSPLRLASGRVGYPLGGLRDWLGLGRTPENRVLELYPSYTAAQTERLLRSLGDGAVRELKRRKVELKMLRRDLDRWVATLDWRVVGTRYQQVPLGIRQVAARQIERCWRRQTSVAIGADRRIIGYKLDLSGMDLGPLPELTADFSHVGVLYMPDMRLTLHKCESFLSGFPSIRRLDLSRNRLIDIPRALEGMRNLETLRLEANRIGLTPRSVEILQGLTRLKNLDLDSNVLGRLPDFSRLPDLERLHLKSTGITAWPTGLRDQPLTLIDLRDNGLTQVPDHLLDPPAERAHVTARLNRVTLLQGNPLSETVQQRMRDYWATVSQTRPEWMVLHLPDAFGFSETVGPSNMQQWMLNLPAGQLAHKRVLWQSLADEPQSGEFFELLHRLANSYQGLKDHPDLQARVWQMLDAMGRSTELRDELFDLAGQPACEDRAALSFSYLEIRLMIHNARALAVGKDEAATLVQLAKGLFRLDEVESIALKNIQRRRDAINARPDLTNEEKLENLALIEEVEVRLAFRVGLKNRLRLPGQPEGGVFLTLGDVTPEMLDAAANQVLALDDSPQQFQSLVGRDFWIDYLKQQHGASFQALNDTLIANQIELDEAKAAGTLEEADYVSQSEALGLQHKIKEAELVQSLTRTELDALPESTDL
ncbi:NEL-type E3 ubiquitin ligase domain-containing protein [Pseudomonas thivervalensis]|uniref:NEL-type E3 ubiquitin ligase domain-containing protein n=1 Tax=Pseudomonas thivervalensis TaxID=86265 RepID=UPI003D648DCA